MKNIRVLEFIHQQVADPVIERQRQFGRILGGAKRLCNEFKIESAPGAGTTIMLARWKA